MGKRYVELFRIKPCLYREGSPVIIEAGALHRDNALNRVLAQIKLRNISDKKIIACKLNIRAFEPNGRELEGIENQPYLDLQTLPGMDFGAKVPVYMPDDLTRVFSAAVCEVVFSDNTVWRSDGDADEWQQIEFQKTIDDHLNDPEIIRQYHIEAGEVSRFVPEKRGDLFLCTCGTINLSPEGKCVSCHKTYDGIIRLLDKDYLRQRAEERIRKAIEEEEKRKQAAAIAEEEKKKQEELKKKKIKKILLISIPSLVIVAALSVLTPLVIVPKIKNMIAYSDAEELLNNGSFDEAQSAFSELGEYSDSETMILECQYQKADFYLKNKRYEDAMEIWDSLGDYSDSAARIENAKEVWKEDDYQAALALMENEDYMNAKAAFDALHDYKDSAEKSAECVELKKEADYQAALTLLNDGKYEEAKKAFYAILDYKDSKEQEKIAVYRINEQNYQEAEAQFKAGKYKDALSAFKMLSDFKDSRERYKEAAYQYAEQLFNSGKYDDARIYYDELHEYKDSQGKSIEACYNVGCQMINERNYARAIAMLQKCKDYNDSAEKLNDAMYGFVNANKDATNTITYQYLKKLVKANYPGAKSIYNELYAWKIDIYAINNSENSKVNMSSISRYDKVYFHYKVSGGPLGDYITETIKFSGHMPGSSDAKSSMEVWSGAESWWSMWFENGHRSGTAKLKIYDSKGNLLATASVAIY